MTKMEGLIARQEKPSNTEVLGLLLDEEKLKFITNLTGKNIKGLCKLSYITKRLANPEKDSLEIHKEVIQDYMILKCSQETKKGNRVDQIVDALKHIIEDENRDDISNLAQEIKS